MIKERFEEKIRELQSTIVDAFSKEDPELDILEDQWERPGGGGGISKILSDGKFIEKGGVNISIVHGTLPEEMKERLGAASATFYASGISLVIHPHNPYTPTVHFNIRYFELYDKGEMVDSWFGGGMDMTPYYLFEPDASHFHNQLKTTCDQFDANFYPKFKERCDKYFFNSHRNEHRGIGGIFYDYLKEQPDFHLGFTSAIGDAFLKAYLPIFQRTKNMEYGPDQKVWQEIRRGRYVEFNLIHDRGTLFGLKTNGRIESILMSLPPTVRWAYNHHPSPGSPEHQLLEGLKPRDWAS